MIFKNKPKSKLLIHKSLFPKESFEDFEGRKEMSGRLMHVSDFCMFLRVNSRKLQRDFKGGFKGLQRGASKGGLKGGLKGSLRGLKEGL